MDLSHVFPAFRERWVRYEDDDIIVVDKPPFMSCMAAQEGADAPKDDLVARLGAYLDGGYIGSHQRLDRDTSGLLVYAKRKEANASLARQFEARLVKKEYLALVRRFRAAPGESRTLRDWLEPPRQGVVAVSAKKTRTALQAITHVTVEEQTTHGVLVRLALETGRTHQARVQLAHAGAPIVGCALYGGDPGPRLFLHAAKLRFEHPRTRKIVEVKSALPASFSHYLRGDKEDWVYDDEEQLRLQLEVACDRRYAIATSAKTNAFRLVNDLGDAFPRLAVDVYGGYAVAQFYEDDVWSKPARSERVLDALHVAGFAGVYAKWRPKQANVLVDTRTKERAPKEAVRGETAPEPLAVLENGVTYLARLGDGLSTGIFLDQRVARDYVRHHVRGKTVLNLFAYQCAFSVAAAAGHAKRTVSVDVSAVALERGRETFGALLGPQHTFVAEDVFKWLERAKKKGEAYDWVILDPPSYSTTKERRFVAESDYAELAALALSVVRPGGFLLASMNHRKTTKNRFRKQLFEAGRLAKKNVVRVRDTAESVDFPAQNGAERYLKSALVEVSS